MIIVDSREPKEIKDMFKNMGMEYEVKQLEIADYIVKYDGVAVAVERKTIYDYISSIEDGRLKNQLFNMSYAYELSYLVVVGYISMGLMETNFKREAYISSLVSSSLKRSPTGKGGQVVTVNVENDYDFALFIKSLDKFITEKKFDRIPAPPRPMKTHENIAQVGMMMAVPLVGEERARDLIKYFGSVQAVCNADIKELMKVPGVGKKTAEKIYKFVRNIKDGDENEKGKNT